MIHDARGDGNLAHQLPRRFQWPGANSNASSPRSSPPTELRPEDADFKRAWDSLQAFRADYRIWKDLGYLD
jgi:hypothetical protein